MSTSPSISSAVSGQLADKFVCCGVYGRGVSCFFFLRLTGREYDDVISEVTKADRARMYSSSSSALAILQNRENLLGNED